MKKNVMFKVAAVMLVLTLASTCIIGTTFAKYVTGDTASDTARVAKWGITVATSGTLFGTNYAANSAADADEIVAAVSDSVSSYNGDSIVAPGTKNTTGFQVKLTGTPEVSYAVTAGTNSVTIEDIFLAAGTYGVMVPVYGVNEDTDISGYYTLAGTTYTLNGATAYDAAATYYDLHDQITVGTKYFPVQWAVAHSGADSVAIAATSDLTVVVNALVDAINGMTGVANNELDATYTLTWEWAFSTDDDTDAKDTILGNLMAADATNRVVKLDGANYTSELTDGVDYNLEIKFGLNVEVTQTN